MVRLILGFLFIPLAGYSQLTNTFKVFGNTGANESAVAVIQLNDGSIYVAGSSNANGTGNTDVALTKLNSNKDSVWTIFYGTTANDYCAGMSQDSGNFILCGITSASGIANDGLILSVDSSGEQLFWREIGQVDLNEGFNYVEPTKDNGYIACGYRNDTVGSGNDFYVVKLGGKGNVVWEKTYGGLNNDYAKVIHQTDDGGYIVSGDSRSFNPFSSYDNYVIKLDSLGNIIWDITIGNDSLDKGNQNIYITKDKNYIICGEGVVDGSFRFDFVLAKISSAGTLMWEKYFGGNGTDAAFGILENDSNQLILSGYSNSNDNNLPLDLVVLKLDSGGNELERFYFGGPGVDIGYSISNCIYGGYLAAGFISEGSSSQYFIVHYEDSGNNAIGETAREDLTVFPNPLSQGQLKFSHEIENAVFKLYSPSGALLLVKHLETPAKELDLSKILTSGVYFYEITQSNTTFFNRIVIIR